MKASCEFSSNQRWAVAFYTKISNKTKKQTPFTNNERKWRVSWLGINNFL